MDTKHLVRHLAMLAVCILFAACGGARKEVSVLPEEGATPAVAAKAAVKMGTVASTVGEPLQLTDGDADNGTGSFHPDGDRVVFQSNRDGRWQIYELDLVDNSQRRLMESDGNDENPVWMPDAGGLLFVSDRDGGGSEWEREIYLFSTGLDEVARVTESPGDDWYPVPDGSGSFLFISERDAGSGLLIYERPNSLYRGYVDGSSPVRLVGPERDFSAPSFWDDQRLIVRTPDGGLGLFNLSDGTLEKITPPDLRCGASSVSPGAGWLAFTAREGDGPYGLYLMDLLAQTIQRIDTPGGEVRFPRFSPDGERVLFTVEVDGRFQLFTIDVER